MEYELSITKRNTDDSNFLKTAIQASGDDRKFMTLVKSFRGKFQYSNKINNELLKELKKLLKSDQKNLFELIQEASDAELLFDGDVDMAHLIRKQRNIIVHEKEYEKTFVAREILSLFAASLLWPNLPE